MQGEASKAGGRVEALVQEVLGEEVGSSEATAANEKIGLSLKGGLKHGVTASSICNSLGIAIGSAKSSLITPMWIMRRSRRRRKRKQRKPILAISQKIN